MTILVPMLMVAGATTLFVLHFYFEHRSEQEAHKFVRDCHGDLPPISFFKDKGYSTVFLGTMVQYYVAADHERERREKGRETRQQFGKSEVLPEWKSPCPRQLCSGNCGSCGFDHCGVCGVRQRDGTCDPAKHAAFEQKFDTIPEGLYPHLPRLDALKLLRKGVAEGGLSEHLKPRCDDCHNHGYVFDFARLSVSLCQMCEAGRSRSTMSFSFSEIIKMERKDGKDG